MKNKLALILLSLMMIFVLSACGGENKPANDDSAVNETEVDESEFEDLAAPDNPEEDTPSEDIPPVEDSAPQAKASIDAVATILGLTGGEEIDYKLIGAVEGKAFNDGTVELYQFDTSSEAWKEIDDTISVAAHQNGIALIFPNNDVDNGILEAFNSLEIA